MRNLFKNAAADIPASVVVFLVALPLCLGIALGSGAPLFSGIIAGMVGGIVIGLVSGSSLSISGPAAGLTSIVAVAVAKMPAYEAFLLSVVIAGVFQVLLGYLRAGVIGDYIPNSVIRGMLASIGLVLILKQFPHLIGYDKDYSGNETFIQVDGQNTFSGIINSINQVTPFALMIGIISLLILIVWERPALKKMKFFKSVPGPLMVVVVGMLINVFLAKPGTRFSLSTTQLVNLPIAKDFSTFTSFFMFPKWEYLGSLDVWTVGLTIALVASIESLLGIEAVDKLDPLRRRTPANLELKAQGVGNIISGLLGGLPLTSVIVRSSANVGAGAKSKLSAIMHGLLILLSVLFIPGLLNKIPLSALAAILIMTGYKLVKPAIFLETFRKGWDQFIPFVVTLLAILFTDLLIGILVGTLVALFSLIHSNFKAAVMVVHDDNRYLMRFRKDISFLNKPIVKEKLESIPADSFILIDISKADFVDKDIIEVVNDYLRHAHLKNIKVEIKKSRLNIVHQLLYDQSTIGDYAGSGGH
jgi:MFS superfamily sulfate permease-like transporter